MEFGRACEQNFFGMSYVECHLSQGASNEPCQDMKRLWRNFWAYVIEGTCKSIKDKFGGGSIFLFGAYLSWVPCVLGTVFS